MYKQLSPIVSRAKCSWSFSIAFEIVKKNKKNKSRLEFEIFNLSALKTHKVTQSSNKKNKHFLGCLCSSVLVLASCCLSCEPNLAKPLPHHRF